MVCVILEFGLHNDIRPLAMTSVYLGIYNCIYITTYTIIGKHNSLYTSNSGIRRGDSILPEAGPLEYHKKDLSIHPKNNNVQ